MGWDGMGGGSGPLPGGERRGLVEMMMMILKHSECLPPPLSSLPRLGGTFTFS